MVQMLSGSSGSSSPPLPPTTRQIVEPDGHDSLLLSSGWVISWCSLVFLEAVVF